jgi:5-methylcytosine-specific restriction endonuclease McrA
MNRNPNVGCTICKRAVYRRPGILKLSKGRAYCSQTCFGISCRQEIPCLICKTPILSGANKITCSRSCANKSRKGIKYKQGSKRPIKDNVKTTRLLKQRLMKLRGRQCERCQYQIFQILQVHHIDRNRQNNSIDNLQLLCPNCHASEHYMKK